MPVAVFVIVTVAPTVTAPLLSLTVPAIVPVETCAKTLKPVRNTRIANMGIRGRVIHMIVLRPLNVGKAGVRALKMLCHVLY